MPDNSVITHMLFACFIFLKIYFILFLAYKKARIAGWLRCALGLLLRGS